MRMVLFLIDRFSHLTISVLHMSLSTMHLVMYRYKMMNKGILPESLLGGQFALRHMTQN